jgi:GTP-binding protein
LGVVDLGAVERFVLADLPGLIEGASEGAGLGHRFLGHVERCAAVLHLVDATTEDPGADYTVIRNELINYGGGIEEKPEIVVLTKCDAIDEETIAEAAKSVEAASGQTPLMISSVSQQGLKPVLFAVYSHVQKRREKEALAREERKKQAAIKRGEIEAAPKGWSP